VRLSAKNKAGTFNKSADVDQREQRTNLEQSIMCEPKCVSPIGNQSLAMKVISNLNLE
jgi:hypothetical protein